MLCSSLVSSSGSEPMSEEGSITYVDPQRCTDHRYKNYYYVEERTGDEATYNIEIDGTLVCVQDIKDLLGGKKKIKLKVNGNQKADIDKDSKKAGWFCYDSDPKQDKEIKIGESTIIIILLEDAWRLDSDRNVIENLTYELKEDDDIIAEMIEDEYVRVLFESEIDSSRIINIYLKNVTSNTTYIELYKKDSDVLLEVQYTDTSRPYIDFILTDMEGVEDEFDFRIVNGSLDIDFITDPDCTGTERVNCVALPFGTCTDFYTTSGELYVQCLWTGFCSPTGAACTPVGGNPFPENLPPYVTNVTDNSSLLNRSYIKKGESTLFEAIGVDRETLVDEGNLSADFAFNNSLNESSTLAQATYVFAKDREIAQLFRTSNISQIYATQGCVDINKKRNRPQGVLLEFFETDGNGIPIGSAFTNGTIENSQLSSSYKFTCANFTKAIKLIPNKEYALVISARSAPPFTYGLKYGIEGYERGRMITKSRGFWIDRSTRYDLKFTVVMGNFPQQNLATFDPDASPTAMNTTYTPLYARDEPFSLFWRVKDDEGLTNSYLYEKYVFAEDIIDGTPPTGNIINPLNGTIHNGVVRIKGNATDASGIGNISYSANGVLIHGCESVAADFVCVWDTRNVSYWNLNNYSVTFDVCDIADNCALLDNFTYFVDSESPWIFKKTISYPNNQTRIKNNDTIVLKINATDNNTNISYVGINVSTLNGTSVLQDMIFESGTNSARNHTTWNISVVINSTSPDGIIRAVVFINDSLAVPNQGVYDLLINLDNTVPTWVNFSVSPKDILYNDSISFFSINASDNLEIYSHIFSSNETGSFVNQSEANFTDETTNEEAVFGKIISNGTFSAIWYIIDEARNINETTPLEFTVLKREPVLNITNILPVEDYNVTGPVTLNFTFNYSGNISDICYLELNDTTNDSISDPTNGTTYNFTKTLTNDTYLWNVICTGGDNRNYTGFERILTVYFNETDAPTIVINTPTIDQAITTSSVSFNITATDQTGVTTCFYNLDNNSNVTMENFLNDDWNHTNSSIAEGNYTANFFCNDTIGNFNDTVSRNFSVVFPSIGLDRVFPLQDNTTFQNETFNVTTQVCCFNTNCSEINVTLDPTTITHYNYSGISNPSSSQIAYGFQNAANPPTTRAISGESEFSTANYGTINTSNNARVSQSAVTGGWYPYQRFLFNITETVSDITEICVHWEGYNTRSGSPSSTLRIWNQTANVYSPIGSHAGGADAILAFCLSNASAYVNASEGNSISVLIGGGQSAPPTSIIYTDFVGINVTATTSDAKGAINTTEGATPFYVNDSNPFNVTLLKDECVNITWAVNATGDVGTNHTFFVYANLTSDPTISNITSNWTVSIIAPDSAAPVIISPPNTTIELNTENLTADFNATDDNPISYGVNISDNFSIDSNGILTNISNLSIGNYILNITVNDSYGNSNSTWLNITVDETQPPTWSLNDTNLTNLTTKGETVNFTATFNDGKNEGTYIFGFYNGSDWENDSNASWVAGVQNDITKIINIFEGDINSTWFFNDSDNNANQTDEWNKHLTTINTSIYGIELNLSDFNLDTDEYILESSFLFNTSLLQTNISLLSSMNVLKLTGAGSNEVWVNVSLDGEKIHEERLRTVSKYLGVTEDEGSTGIQPLEFNVTNGEHNISFWFRRTGKGVVEINDIDVSLWEAESTENKTIRESMSNVSLLFSDLTLTEQFRIQINDSISSEAFVFGKFNINSSAETNVTCRYVFPEDNITSDIVKRHLEDNTEAGAISLASVESVQKTNYNISLECSSSTGAEVSLEGKIVEIDLKDQESNTINEFHNSNMSTNLTNIITLTAGTYELTNVSHQFKSNGDSMLVSAGVSFYSTSGIQTPYIFMNSTLGNCYSKKERFLKGDGKPGNVFIYKACQGTVTQGQYHNFSLYLVVPTGETIVVEDEHLSGFEAKGLQIDEVNTMPLVAILTPTDSDNKTGTFNINWSDTDNQNDARTRNVSLNISTTEIQLQNQTTVFNFSFNSLTTDDGYYNLTVVSCENSTTQLLCGRDIISIRIDNSPPNITINQPVMYFNYSTTTIELNITSNSNDISNFSYDLNGAGNVTFNPNITFVGVEGSNNITIYANDTTGLVNWTLINFTIDTIQPNLIINTPANLSYWGTGPNEFNEYINITIDEDIVNCTHNNFITWWNLTLNSSTTFSFQNNTGLIEGLYLNTNISCYDYAGNNGSTYLTFTIDKTAPNINLSNTSFITNNDNFGIHFNFTDSLDGDGLNCSLYLNETQYDNASRILGGSEHILNATGVSEGNYTLNITCTDNANNTGFNDSEWVYYIAPILNITLDYPTSTTYNFSVSELNYTISNSTVLAACWYSLDEDVTNTTITCFDNVTGLSPTEGSNTWIIYVNDSVGTVASSNVTFTIDTTDPTITIALPNATTDETYNISSNIPLNYSSDENITDCVFSLNGAANVSIPGCLNTTISGSIEGNNTITVCGNDNVSNSGCSDVRTYEINTQVSTLVVAPYEKDYNTTEEINITSMCYFTNGTDCTSTTNCRLVVYYPNETLLLGGGLMTFEGSGLYTYNLSYTSGSSNTEGTYSSAVTCYNGQTQEAPFTFTVSDGTTSTSTIVDCRYRKFGVYNKKLPYFIEENCI